MVLGFMFSKALYFVMAALQLIAVCLATILYASDLGVLDTGFQSHVCKGP